MHVPKKERNISTGETTLYQMVVFTFKLVNITFRGGREALKTKMILMVPPKKRYLKLK